MSKKYLDRDFYNLVSDMAADRVPEAKKEKAPQIVKNKLSEAFGGATELTPRMWRKHEDLIYEII